MYTHYFIQKKAVPKKQWNTLCERVKQAFDIFQAQQEHEKEKIFICSDDGEKIITNAQSLIVNHPEYGPMIRFNGHAVKEQQRENFSLYQLFEADEFSEPKAAYMYCKTDREPYDWFVVAVLILVNHYCASSYKVRSDGRTQEWQPVLDWVNKSLKTSYKMPCFIKCSQDEEDKLELAA